MCPDEKTSRHRDTRDACAEEKLCEDTVRRWPSISQGEASEETKSANTPISDFWPPKLRK